MIITCEDCGCPYDSSCLSCPDCGCPNPKVQGKVTITNCPNCGAPVSGGSHCDYCGSAYPRIVQQGPQVIVQNNTNYTDDSGSVLGAFAGGLLGGLLS